MTDIDYHKAFKILLLSALILVLVNNLPVLANTESQASGKRMDDAALPADTDTIKSGVDEPADHNEQIDQTDDFDDFDTFDEFDEFEDEDEIAVYDPLGGYNRFMTDVNDRFYVWVFRPVAKAYCFIAPKPFREAIGRMYANGLYPVDFVNNLLQLKPKRAAIVTGRFCINTTMGIAGLFDPAGSCMELEAYPEDFGQTLGYYGVGSGPHIVIPFIGPSNTRDIFGFVPDTFLRPTYYIRSFWAVVGITVLDHFNNLSLFMDEYDALRQEAFDLYIFQRDAYEMRRQKLVED
jgi:phospholipid-binding lipoprotein MlaA